MSAALPIDITGTASIATQLKEQLRWLIALGDLAPGDRLPTVQALADNLRINRNTVAEAYAALRDEGLLHARQGQGTFVADSDAVRRLVHKADLGRLIDEALARALALGYTPDEFAEAASARSRVQASLRRRHRALFVECNDADVTFHTHTLTEALGIAVEGVHLDDVRADPEAFRRRVAEADLVLTTLFHIEEVRDAAGARAEVIGLGASLQMQLLRSLAQLPRGTRVAIACLDRERATRIRKLVVNAGVQHLETDAIGVDEEERFRRALADVDAIYVSAAAFPQARRLVRDPSRLRTYQLVLDRAGVEMLKVRLAERDDADQRRSRRGA